MSGSKSLPPDVHEALAPLPPRLRYRRARRTVYELLVVPSVESRLHRYVRGGLSLLILANVVAVVLETVPGVQADMGSAFAIFEAISVAVFSVEYLLRLWVAVEDPRYARPLVGRLRFVVTFFALVDLVAILPFFLPHLTNVDARFLRVLRLVRLARVLKLGRYSESVALYGRILHDKRHELLASTGFLFLLLLIASSVMYFLEHEAQPQHFSSIPGAMWWGIITLTTIGYGDVVPATGLGRVVGGVIAVIGIGFVALPSAILVSGMMEQLDLKKKAQNSPAAGGEAQRSTPAPCPKCGRSTRD